MYIHLRAFFEFLFFFQLIYSFNWCSFLLQILLQNSFVSFAFVNSPLTCLYNFLSLFWNVLFCLNSYLVIFWVFLLSQKSFDLFLPTVRLFVLVLLVSFLSVEFQYISSSFVVSFVFRLSLFVLLSLFPVQVLDFCSSSLELFFFFFIADQICSFMVWWCLLGCVTILYLLFRSLTWHFSNVDSLEMVM